MAAEPGQEPILDEYRLWAVQKRTNRTVNLYLRYLRSLAEFANAAGKGIETLSSQDIEKFVGSYSHWSSGTQANQGSALKNFYRFLQDTRRRGDDPTQLVQFEKGRRPPARRRPGQVSQRLAKLEVRNRLIALVVGELLEKGATLLEIFAIDETPPVGTWVEVENEKGERRPLALSGHARARLDEWGGSLPVGGRQFQKIVRKVGLRPKDLGDPSRPGLADFHSTLLPDESLHEELDRRARPAFLRGEYDTAVFEAMKAVEVAVRKASGYSAQDIGVGLMRAALDVKTGPLRDPGIVKAERQATSDLFAGAIGLFKNPSSHRDVNPEDPIEVAGVIRLADVLLRIVERAGSR